MKTCPKCNEEHNKNGRFCSSQCANSRGPRTDEFKNKVSLKLKGKNYTTPESIKQSILSRGRTPHIELPNTICLICDKDTNTKHRKTCSNKCLTQFKKIVSQQNSNCGGQKHTHREKIMNLKGEIFIAESSFEVKLSSILNSLQIDWIRPKFIWYKDKNDNKRRYYPDFYLTDFDLYLDPKNDYLIKTDIDKIIRAAKSNNIFIIIIGENYINVESIKKMVGDRGNAPLIPACKTGTLLLS